MPNLVQGASASTRRGFLALACVLSGLLCAHASVQAGPPLVFRWPVPCRVGVTTISERDSTALVGHEIAHLFATPNPAELKLGTEDPQLWDLHVGSSRPADGQTSVSQILSLLSNQPPMTISRTGEFVRCQFSDEYMVAMERLIRQQGGPDVDSTMLRKAMEILRSPEIQSRMQSEVAESWETWAGSWIDLELEDGEEISARIPVPWMEGTIESDVQVANLGPTKPGGNLIRLALVCRTGGEEARDRFEKYLRGLAGKLGSGPAPPGPVVRGIKRTTWSSIVLEPASMRPNYANNVMLLEMEDSAGTHRRYESASYFFEWDPPLPTGRGVDPVPPNGLAAYLANRLPEAYDTLRTAVEDGTRNPDTYAYLAEACRRLDRLGEGALFARRALALDPRHAFAHGVLAGCYNVQLGQWPLANGDSTWAHLLQSAECDSTDGNAWLGIWIEAKRRGRSDLELRSLTKLLDTGFLTRPILAYARWMLQDLPESTVLVTNGDMDSYPAWALQANERLRPDVAVLNYSLLNLPWYARSARDGLRVPLPFSDSALDSLEPQFSDSGLVRVSEQILRGWLDHQASGAFRRPLAVSITVPEDDLPPEHEATLIGPALLYRARTSDASVDTAAVRVSLSRLRAKDFVGRQYAERDRSPIRRLGSLSENIVKVWLYYADTLGRAGRRRQAQEVLRKASDFAREMEAPSSLRQQITEMQAAYRP